MGLGSRTYPESKSPAGGADGAEASIPYRGAEVGDAAPFTRDMQTAQAQYAFSLNAK